MSHYDTPDPVHPEHPHEPHQDYGTPRTSALAVSSLVCSLVCCIPGVPLIGALLGIAGVVATSRNPNLHGRGMAIAGIVLGILLSVGQGFAALGVVIGYGQMRDAPYQALAPGFAGDIPGFKDRYGPAGRAVPDEEAEAFIEELRRRYGALQASALPLESFEHLDDHNGMINYPARLVFDRATVDVEITLDMRATQRSPHPVLQSITIIDPQEGDMTFPPPGPSP